MWTARAAGGRSNGELTSLALTVSGLGVHVEDRGAPQRVGQLALATLKSADCRWPMGAAGRR